MRKIIYIFTIVVFVCSMLTGCISQSTIDELIYQVQDLEDDIEDIEDENEEYSEDIAALTLERDAALEYNGQLKQEKVDRLSRAYGEFSITFAEFYAQLIYLSYEWNFQVFIGPEAIHMEDFDNLRYPFVIPVNGDETCSKFEVHIEADPESEKLVLCTVVIVQDEEFRDESRTYNEAYKYITEMVLSALILAQNAPYDADYITAEMLEGIMGNDQAICNEYNMQYEVYVDSEYEARYIYTIK